MTGISNGIMIEGGAVYAYDPVFKPIHHDDHKPIHLEDHFHHPPQQAQTETNTNGS